MLPDGSYDVLVVDAEPLGDQRAAFDLTILSGAFKGDVVSVRAPVPEGADDIDLLGIPGTLVVDHGEPHVTFEP